MIQESSYLGQPTLLIDTPRARCEVSLIGGQVLSFIPRNDGRDVLWCGIGPRRTDQALHGGIPLCWPWFAKQDRPPDAMQHGFVRSLRWQVIEAVQDADQQVRITLRCTAPHGSWPNGADWPITCQPELTVVVTDTLTMHLKTVNESPHALVLTQALHTYFRVGDVRQAQIRPLAGLRFQDKLRGMATFVQDQDWQFEQACDRIYLQSGPHHTIDDPVLRRRILISSPLNHSTVVWNPGAVGVTALPDIPPHDWHQFICFEAAHCGPLDRVALAPGDACILTQHIAVEPWPTHSARS